jgi:hypothetical protein
MDTIRSSGGFPKLPGAAGRVSHLHGFLRKFLCNSAQLSLQFQLGTLDICKGEVDSMSVSGETFGRPLAPELAAVAEAAGSRLRSEVAAERDVDPAVSQELLAAATAAISAKYSLMEIAQAEARGKEKVRRELGGDALERVERTGHQAREAEAEHHRAIGRAMRLGLSMREIALAAGVTHGTIRAIGNRLAENGVSRTMAAGQVHGEEGEVASSHSDRNEMPAIAGKSSSDT